MASLTCLNCCVEFSSADVQRAHYKTDWHRYNLKRRVAELPPITAEQFNSRILVLQNAAVSAIQESRTNLYCNACRKQFSNEKAHDNHLSSKKHKANLIQFQKEHGDGDVVTKSTIKESAPPAGASPLNHSDKEESIEDYEIDSDEWEDIQQSPLSVNDCLFCSHSSEEMVENLKHMSISHSFFIPDTEYCVDFEGLLNYLGEKIAIYFVCLWCNDRGKTFHSLDAVRKHMVDKGHCCMLHEGVALAEYADYYDYSSSYPDHEEGMDVDEEVVPELLDGDEYQLVLPSGAVIGHRSLLRYYKQHLPLERTFRMKKSDRKLHKILSAYRAIGWTKTQQDAAARRARDIHLMKRVQSKYEMRLGCKANKLQKHFRQQVMM